MRHIFINLRNRTQEGFTVVELIVAVLALSILTPLVIYSLGDLYTDNIASLGKTAQSTNTLSTLQTLKNELTNTSVWLTSLPVNKPLGPTNSTSVSETWSYCGTNGTSDCNVAGANRVLIAYTSATDKASTDTTRVPIFANTGGSCDPNNSINTIKVAQIYFVAADLTTPSQNDLYRRTIVNPTADTICNGAVPYQTTTCNPSVFSQANCKDGNGDSHQDAVLLTNVSSFKVDYFTVSSDSSAITNEYTGNPASITAANAIQITVTSSMRIRGTMTPNVASIRITRQY